MLRVISAPVQEATYDEAPRLRSIVAASVPVLLADYFQSAWLLAFIFGFRARWIA